LRHSKINWIKNDRKKKLNAVTIEDNTVIITETLKPENGMKTVATKPTTMNIHPSVEKNVAQPQSF
jgi:hypothetical protein